MRTKRLLVVVLTLMLAWDLVPTAAWGEATAEVAGQDLGEVVDLEAASEDDSAEEEPGEASWAEDSASEEGAADDASDDAAAEEGSDASVPGDETEAETAVADESSSGDEQPTADEALGEGADEDVPLDEEPLASEEEAVLEEEGSDATSEDDLTAQDDTEQDLVSLANAKVTVASQTYTGSALTPKPTVTLDGATLALDTDYEVSYRDNVNAGMATLVVTGIGAYTDSATATFQIGRAALSAIEDIADQAYTGSAVKPKPVVKSGKQTLKLATDYTLSYKSNVKAGTATVTATGTGNYRGSCSATFQIVAPTVGYKAYRQTTGWEASWKKNGKVSGTTSASKRLEGIRLKLGTGFPVSGGIMYRARMQSYGWRAWAKNGATSGVVGKSKRMEAVQIKLTGQMAKKYDVWYRVHVQQVGWMAWAKNGQVAGTTGLGWRLEAIQVVLRPKGAAVPGDVRGIASVTSLRRLSNPGVTYRSSIASTWSAWKKNGKSSGKAGKGTALSAVEAKLGSDVAGGSLRYRTKLKGGTWSAWAADGETSGTASKKSTLQVLRMKLKGEAVTYFDVWYRVHVASCGWLGWACNGASAGTGCSGDYVDAYQVRIVQKGAAAPGKTTGAYCKETVRHGLEAAKSSRAVTSFGGFSASKKAVRKLKSAIAGIRNQGYDVGFICMDLASLKGVAYNCDGVFYGASSIKAPYIASVVSLHPDAITKYQFYMQETLFYSWDYAYKEVYYGYGKAPMRTWCRDSGARASIAESLPWANYSARDLALMWGHTYTWYGRSSAMETLGTWCERPNISTIHDTLGDTYRTRSKGGWIADGGAVYAGVNGGGPLWDVTDDGGIVYATNGDYVMAIMSSIPANHGALHTLTAAIDAAHAEM